MVRICVIGAGASGLIAAKHAKNRHHEVVVYEQCAEVGGIWLYSEEVNVHSAMYEVMKTNLPKEMMLYRDVPFAEELPSFMDHPEVLKYLRDFAQELPIEFNTKVESVKRVNDSWEVSTESNGNISSKEFDTIFVCNGHYVAPHIPFSTENFNGIVFHSHDYRHARNFVGKKVVVAGAGPSGIDIALQVSQFAHEIVMVGKKAVYPVVPSNMKQVEEHVKSAIGNKVILSNEEEIENVDVLIICTGYRMEFPFLEKGLIEVKADGQMVSPLFEHVVHVEYPSSLFFIGIPLNVVTMTLFEHQVLMSLAFMEKKTNISQEELRSFETQRLRKLEKEGRGAGAFHSLPEEQWEYFDRMAEIGKFEKWNYHELMKKMFTYILDIRKKNVMTYKNVNFVLNENKTDFEVRTLT